MKPRRNLLLGTLVVIALSHAASAATYNWIGGAGNWDTTSANWSGAGTTWPTTGTDNDAVFGATGGIVTIAAGGVTANDIAFTSDGYTISGAGLTLNGAIAPDPVTVPTITTAVNTLTTISSIISGASGLTKAGTGDLILSGANNYTGATTISAGTLIAGNGAALGSSADGTTVASGAALDIGGQNLGTEVVTISGTGLGDGAIVNTGVQQINALGRIVLGANATVGGGVRWDLRNSSPTLNMAGFTLTKTGSNYIGLIATAVSNPGNIVVDGGELSVSTGTTLGGSSTNSVTVDLGGILSFYQSSSPHAWSLNLNDGSTLRGENGTGTQNTWTGPVTVTGGVTLQADGILNLPANITGTAEITKTGSGTAILSGSNNITSTALTINGGSFQANNASGLTSATTITTSGLNNSALVLGDGLAVGSGRTLTIAGAGAGGFYGALSTTGTATWDGNVTIGAATGTRVGTLGTTGSLTINGVISEPAGTPSELNIRTNGAAVPVVLTNANTFTGNVAVINGTLRLTNSQALGLGTKSFNVQGSDRRVELSNNITLGSNITLNLQTNTNLGVLSTSGSNVIQGAINLSGGGASVGSNGSSTLTLNGNITSTGGTGLNLYGTSTNANTVNGILSDGTSVVTLSKNQSGTWVLAGDNTYTGATTISAGTLKLDYSTNGGSKLSDGALTLGSATLELAGGNHPEIVASTTLSGTTSSTVTRSSGTSVLQMNGITRNSAAYINFAQSGIATTDTLNNTTGLLGTWATIGGTDWAANSTNAADGLITPPTYTLSSVAANTSASYAAAHITVDSNQAPGGLITPNSLRFNGPGAYTLTLQGANTIASGGILVGTGTGTNTSTITGGTLTGPVSGDLIIHQNNPDGNLVIASQIINNTTTNVVKTGVGPATLSGDNTYTGSTTVSGGTLTLSGNKTGNSGAITVSNLPGVNATMNIQNGTYAVGGNNFIVGNAQGTPATGTVNQSGGVVSFSSGNGLLLGNAGTTASTGIYNLSGGSINTATSSANRGVIIGTNENSINIFNLSGSGALNMTAATGGTATSVLQVGRFDVSSGANNTTNTFNQTGGTANVAIFSVGGNGTSGVNLSSTVNWTGGVFVASSFPRLSAGNTNTATLTIGGTADVTLPAFPTARGTSSTATLNFDGGVLKPAAASTAYLGGLNNAFIKAGGAKFNVDTGKDITVSQALLTDLVSTGGGLTKEGAGKLTLTGANTYTGTTLISAGTLEIGSAGTTGSLSPSSAITNNGTLTFNRTDALTQGTDFGVISGIGGVTKLGTGTLILSGANSYQGNTLFGTAVNTSTGILRLANSSALGSSKLIINNGNADTGSVELTGGITVPNNIDFFGRSSSVTAAIIRNVSGNNELSGVLTGSFNGGNYNFHSDAGTLTISNKITTVNTGRVLNLRGVGAINITGVIEDGSGNIGVRSLDAGTYTLAGLNTYTRNTEVGVGSAITLTGQIRFVPTASGTTNNVFGTGTFNANGTFLIDLAGADTTAGNSWLLVNVGTLDESFGAGFTVTSTAGAFTETSAGVWERTASGKKWTFTESTGTLSVADAVVDDYLFWAGTFSPPVGLPGADDDGDGVNNFEEYAFGLDPKSGASSNPITQQLNKGTGLFKYTRRATPATTNVTYTYESSTTLGGWDPFTPDSAVSDNAPLIEEITVDVPDTLLANPKLFIRVRAVK